MEDTNEETIIETNENTETNESTNNQQTTIEGMQSTNEQEVIVEKLRLYFDEHVSLATEFENILIDFLDKEAITYTIEPIPTDYIVSSYTDGSSLRQFVFQFSSREYYDESVAQQISNLGFYEKFQNEIETNNNSKILPDIDGIQSIECLNYGTIQDVQTGTAKYSIQMRITYFRDYNQTLLTQL